MGADWRQQEELEQEQYENEHRAAAYDAARAGEVAGMATPDTAGARVNQAHTAGGKAWPDEPALHMWQVD